LKNGFHHLDSEEHTGKIGNPTKKPGFYKNRVFIFFVAVDPVL